MQPIQRYSYSRPWILALGCLSMILCFGAFASQEKSRPMIAVIPKGTTHEFWKTVHAGALKGASESGVDILWKGPAREDDRDDQIKVVESAVSRKVQGIVIAPLDEKALVPSLREAAMAKIPVVVFDSGIKWDGRSSFVATDNRRGGILAAEEMGRILAGQGKVVMMRYVEGSASTSLREDGFLSTMKEKFPAIQIVSSDQYGGATVDSAYRVAENLFNRFPDLDGFYAPNESTTYACMKAATDLKRGSKVHLVGFDASEKLVAGLRAGSIDALVVQNPFRMGELAVTTMAKVIRGENVPKDVDTGCTLVTRANIDDPAIRTVLEPPIAQWLK
ncbi:MAG: substrate-binding domain-containing protein [Planctomycetota bacterium]|nr:substrate-binding domain-containing protein [Planctomycetota bacterium]MDA1263251.1 substrate-binding domain-containing protein [Planctomycetota bacterium]